MYPIRLRGFLIGAVLTALSSGDLRAQGLPPCRLTPGAGINLQSTIASYVTALPADSGLAIMRDRLQLPVVPGAQVTIVSDTLLCGAARVALASVVGVPAESLSVVVVHMPNRFIVVDPEVVVGEWATAVVYDSTFTCLARFGY